MACDAIGAFNGEPKNFVDFVLEQDVDGSCQNVKVGADSPGPVLDDEVLARFVFCPTHLKKNGDEYGQIDESLFTDITSIGGSVNRLIATDGSVTESIHQRGESIAALVRRGTPTRSPQPDRHYLGAIKLATHEIRALVVDEVARRLRVYDTSRGPDDSFHGDIVANMRGLDKEKKTLRKELRVALYMLAIKSSLYVSPYYQGFYEVAKCGLVVDSDESQTGSK
jgi:hypothetical protein